VSEGYLLQKLTASNVGAISVVFVLILRLYSGWGYIGSRCVIVFVRRVWGIVALIYGLFDAVDFFLCKPE
jgi:hypothetical protein